MRCLGAQGETWEELWIRVISAVVEMMIGVKGCLLGRRAREMSLESSDGKRYQERVVEIILQVFLSAFLWHKQ